MSQTKHETSARPTAAPTVTRTRRAAASRGMLLGVAFATLGTLGFAGAASAVDVPVANQGFEDPVLGNGGYNTSVTGWTKLSGAAGTFNPTNAHFTAEAAEGANTSYSNGSTISQTLAATLQAGTYTLTVEVGDRKDTPFPGYRVQLGVDDGGFQLLAEDNSSLAPNDGFLTSTVAYTATAGDAHLGGALVVRLVGNGLQVNFDDVLLDFQPLVAGVNNVYLLAASTTMSLPGGATAAAWVFDCDPIAPVNPSCTQSQGGARISALEGDELVVHVRNTLPVPVSLSIPGQNEAGGGPPQMMTDAVGRSRVRSFTHEVAPSATGSYTWDAVRAGTYLYQSGTVPSLQVPMGLHGPLVVSTTTIGCAYDSPESCHDAVVVPLVFSEIDPLQNQRVADAAAAMPLTHECVPLIDFVADPAVVGYPCTVDYDPRYFLINGSAHDPASLPPSVSAGTAYAAGNPGDVVLLRLLNAGLRTHNASVVGLDLDLIAEDGNVYPGLPRRRSAALLPAGKTVDAIATMPGADATLALFDRMLNLSNDNDPDGGMLAYLQVGAGSVATAAPSPAVNDSYDVGEDGSVGGNVFDNDSGLMTASLVNGPANGTLTLNPDGTFTYTPNADFSGSDSFTYSATDGTNTYAAQVILNVSFVNDPPVAADDGPYVNAIGAGITVDATHGVLGNDADPDGDALTAMLDTGPANGTLVLDTDGSFSYTPDSGFTGSDSFTYYAEDEAATSSATPATVTLNVNPVADIALTVMDPEGNELTQYRWLVQEDATFHVDPSAPGPFIEQQSLNFHKSYMPVVARGCIGCAQPDDFSAVALDPAKHYYVSVLPNDAGTGEGHTIGGAQILPGADAVTVFVNNQQIPTAQISVLAFVDHAPTNGVPDADEPGLGGVQIVLEDAGGRYGISGGAMLQDAFGNPLKNSLECAPPATAGVILTCPNGAAQIKDLPPGKYGVVAIPPAGGPNWLQTSTIEGTKVIDAWVKAKEPQFFTEFGRPAPHAFIGFVNPDSLEGATGAHTITGQVTLLHDPRPPAPPSTNDSGSYAGLSHTRAWVGLNSIAGDGPNIKTVLAEPDGSFSMSGIPDGSYQLVVFDAYLDQIIAFQLVEIAGGDVDAGNVPVNNWFARAEHNVFLDSNENGVWDDGEQPLPEQAVNLRWRDGTVNQAFPTDTEGFVPFDEVFPFFSWQVFEVDYTRFKPTGVTVTVDAGGDVSTGPYPGLMFPQPQGPCTQEDVDRQQNGCTVAGEPFADPNRRTELGSTVLLEGFQGFPGQTSLFEWGKKPYAPGENGGISGVVFYSSTRGENDPRLTVGDPWEPGIPGVKVRLYREVARGPSAGSIAVVNAGFEDPVLGNGAFVASVAGWTKLSGAAGTFNPTTAHITGEAAQGQNTSYSNGSTIQQTLAAALEAGSYELTVAVGDRKDTSFPGYRVQLGVVDGGFQLLAEDNSSLVPNDGFATSTVTHTAVAGDPHLGSPLAIRLVGKGTQINFDDVQLHFAPPGAPSGLALVAEVETDSWDDALPEGCAGEAAADPFTTETLGVANIDRCYDGWRNWNQVRPAVFDGGYAFNDIPAGKYVVEVVVPPGYEQYKEEDVNVGFGDAFGSVSPFAPVSVMLPNGMLVIVVPDPAQILAAMGPEPGLAQPRCIGEWHVVPDELSLFPGMEAPFAGAPRPLCNRKEVILSDQGQAAADFHLFTSTPVAGQFTGLITDDISSETDPRSPGFGEKWSPAFLPVSIRDFTGREVYRTYGDSFGRYNGVLPSTFTANIPIPSGYSPSMMLACLNDPGTGSTLDPLVLAGYGNACYTAQFMPGTTTYLDTPVLPTAAFAAGYSPPDCAAPAETPVVVSVDSYTEFGPYLPSTGGFLEIKSAGMTEVANPEYEGPLGSAPPTISRDHGFGTDPGTVRIGTVDVTPAVWNTDMLLVEVPAGTPSGELVVTRANGNSTVNTVTVTLEDAVPTRVAAGGSIQDAIDAANPGDLILVEAGSYDEMVVMWKPVRLQGSGAATVINARNVPTEKFDAWLAKVQGLVDGGSVDLLPGQPNAPELGVPGLLGTEQGAGITVLAQQTGPRQFLGNASRIDGFTITGANGGGGIFVNGFAHGLEIANNQVTENSGNLHGGIRIGHPFLELVGNGPFGFDVGLSIHHNAVTKNGAQHFESAGGGISLSTGTDGYEVADNFICGNFTAGNGAGIGHLGLSDGGTIRSNEIVLNQSVSLSFDRHGGGIFVGGEPGQAPALSRGTGNVTIDANLVQSNQAGSGQGGGIRLEYVNGLDLDAAAWQVTVTNNMVTNNVAAWAGGGIALQDAVNVDIVNNTIANNDSTATLGALIPLGLNASQPQPAGIASAAHSPGLSAVLPGGASGFSDPTLDNNIVWHNRAFHFDGNVAPALQPEVTQSAPGACNPATPAGLYWDLGVLGQPQVAPALKLAPTYSVLSDIADYGGASNVAGDPDFEYGFCNGARTLSAPGPMLATAAFGEGGNFVDVRFGPLTRGEPPYTGPGTPWDYHVGAASVALDNGSVAAAPDHDFDDEFRPQGAGVERGADEIPQPVLAPVLVSITPSGGEQGVSGLAVTLGGSELSGATLVNVSGTGVTCGVTGSTATSVDASCSIAVGAAPGARDVSVTTPGGTSGNVTFTVTAPVFPAPAVLDDFNRGNANNLGGNWQQLVTSPFLGQQAGIRVNAQQALCGGPGLGGFLCGGFGANAYWGPGVFGATQAAAFTFANGTTNGNALYLKAGGGFVAGAYQNAVRVRYAAGFVVVETTASFGLTYTSAGTLPGSFATGDRLTAQVDASGNVRVWRTSGATTTFLGQVAAGGPALAGSGRIGLYQVTGARVDDFAGN